MSGFQFMPHVFDMISASPQANMNMDYNLWNSQLKRDSIMYMNPGFQASAFLDYPIFATFGNNLLDPSLAIGQTLQAFRNGNWMNGGCNNGNWFNNPWNNNPWNNNNNKPATVEDKLKQAEYEDLKKILQAYKNLNEYDLNRKEKVEIDDAISKSGTLDEKLSAIKDALKKIHVDKLRSAVLSDEELKAKLTSCGYNLSNDKLNVTDDENLMENLDTVKKELGMSPAKYETLIHSVCQGEGNEDILRIISYWYDKNPGESIISMITNKINTTNGEGTDQSKAVNNLTMSLIKKVNPIKAAHSSSDLSKLDAATKAVSDALDKVNGKDGFTKPNLEDLAEKFDTLYAMLRIMEASIVDAKVKKDYQKLLKDSLGKEIIPDNFIVDETITDLEKEGITIPEVDDIEELEINNNDEVIDNGIDDLESVEEKIKALKGESGNKSIVDSAKAGVYKTNAALSTEKPHFYITKGDKILELKDVVDIDANGNCTMKDGSKKSLGEAKKNTTEVNPSDIMQYKATLKRVAKLINDKTLIPCKKPEKLGNNTLYRSNGKNLKGKHQYFIVKDGKLMQIKCKAVYERGTIETSSGNKTFEQLTDDDFSEIKDDKILKEDEKKETVNENEEENTVTDTNPDKPSEAGKVLRERLHGDTYDYSVVDKKIDEFGKYTAVEDIVSFIEGYNKEKDPFIAWNDELCAQISTENDYSTSKKEKALKTIAKQILKVMNELEISKDSEDYTDMEYYAKNGPKRQDGTFWKTWSFWNSERTGVANHMDDIIERILEQYREKYPKD